MPPVAITKKMIENGCRQTSKERGMFMCERDNKNDSNNLAEENGEDDNERFAVEKQRLNANKMMESQKEIVAVIK